MDNVRVDIAPAGTSAPLLDDPVLLLPESAEPLHRASAPEAIVLTGWGGGANCLGYDFLQMFVIASVQPLIVLIPFRRRFHGGTGKILISSRLLPQLLVQ